MQQRTPEWYEARRGRFTASDIIDILGKKGFGETGKKRVIQKAYEQVYGISEEDQFISWDMRRGIELEPIAFLAFQERKELEFSSVREASFYTNGLHAGASPDGLVDKDGVLEIKCPSSDVFFLLQCTGDINPKYYAQMQMQMLCTGRSKAYYYNYLIYNNRVIDNEIIVERDEEYIKLIEDRLKEAIEMKLEFVDKLKSKLK